MKLPKWATALDVVAVRDGPRRDLGRDRRRLSHLDLRQPAFGDGLVAAGARGASLAIAIRHALVRQQPLPQRVVARRRSRGGARRTRKVVLPIHLASRLGVLLVGFLAVILIGFPPEAANRWRIYSNDFLDLPGAMGHRLVSDDRDGGLSILSGAPRRTISRTSRSSRRSRCRCATCRSCSAASRCGPASAISIVVVLSRARRISCGSSRDLLEGRRARRSPR